ncbi:serine hydrolase domain-containing protein [Plantactinospora sp. WMMB782]|uniref:serine hydrolase domain-containing protein n=1 Tax=Plantactinospora sp. WMMB782 TaxID=3404121 RepID=UPI003B95B193
MATVTEVQAILAARVPELLREHRIPGAAWAVLHDGQIVDGAAGLLSTGTGVEATPDSLFQIGSITKLWTSTLVLQLVDEGRVELDEPVRTYLPEFRIGDEAAAAVVTTRQLLNHTAGFEGDIFTDTGVGDDCLARFVDTLHDVPQLFAPGEQFSYNNAGYCVLGRLVEVVRGIPYDECLRRHLIGPLGLTHAATGPYEAILHRVAVGHLAPEPGADPRPAPVWALARSNAPAGAMLAMRPRDLLGFARMHLADGRAADGTQVLAPGTAARMRQREVGLPDLGLMGTSWGLGFERFDTPTGALVGHDGNTIGQAAFLRIVVEDGLAVTLLTNGGDAMSLYRDVFRLVLGELGSVGLPDLPRPPEHPEPVDARRFVGTYTSQVAELAVSQDEDGRIWIEQTPRGDIAELVGQPSRRELVHYRGDSLIPLEPEHGIHLPHAFVGDDGAGRARFLHVGRAVRRVDATTPAG